MPETAPILDATAEPRATSPGPLSPGLDALLHRAAYAPITDLGWVRVTGSDRVRWLNGMATNNIAALQPGQGNYNFFLNAQGRILGDCTAFLLEDSILLETDRARIPALIAALDHFIIMDDVELAPIDDLTGILIAGPQALSIVQALGTSNRQAAPCSSEPQPPAPPALNLKRTFYAGKAVSLVRAHHPMATRLEVWSDAATSELLSKELHGTEVAPANPTDLEHLRILSGTPLYGIDIRNSDTAKDLPQETNQTRALHFSKGCYLGQEIVERIRSRGQVHRTFYGFLLSGELPAAGAVLRDPDAKAVGELTSVARIQLSDGPHQLALGYIRREALDKGLPLTYDGGTAKPSALPFQL